MVYISAFFMFLNNKSGETYHATVSQAGSGSTARYFPLYVGFLFSRKACTPSLWSAVPPAISWL